MAESKTKVESPREEGCEPDDELNDLLDSALDGFRQIQTSVSKITETIASAKGGADGKTEKSASQKAEGASSGSTEDSSTQRKFVGDDFSEQVTQQMEEAMKMFMEEDPTLMQQMEKLAQAAGNIGNTAAADQDFTATLAQTLTGMSQNTSQLQDHLSDEHMAQAFSGMNFENDMGVEPMMQDMMKSLLSKEVLYPSLKEMREKYPEWLKKNNEKVEKSKLDVYRKQYKIIEKICKEFEAETEKDSDDTKSKRFQNILDLMQQMQELGQPPEEIVGQMAPGLKFDEHGLPNLPGMPEGCAVM